MASRYFGTNRGGTLTNSDVSQDSSTTSKNIELVVDLTASCTRNEVLDAIERIKCNIIQSDWPPA